MPDAIAPSPDRFWAALLGAACHELRNPLGVACFAARNLAESLAQPETRASAERLERALGKLEAVLADLSDASRLGRGEPLNLEELDLRELASRAASVFGATQPTAKVSIVVPQVPVAGDVDGARLTEALVHLLDEALRSSMGGREIALTLTATPTQARIEVGAGPDGRLRATTLRALLARSVVEAHGGTLELRVGDAPVLGVTVPLRHRIWRSPDGELPDR